MSTRRSNVFFGLLIAMTSVVVTLVLTSRLDMVPGSFARDLHVPEANTADIDGPLDATTFRNVAAQAGPAVVNITVRSRREAPSNMLDIFGFGDPNDEPQLQQGSGSGFIIDAEEGYIVTNNHVVAGAEEIDVLLAGMDDLDTPLRAQLVGRDELTDSALIKLVDTPREPLTAATFGDSDQMMPGDWVMAIGSPFGLTNTVTVGVVSAAARETQVAVQNRFAEMIQTDAAINRGNSGGPLLNIRGEVVGINTMILSDNPLGGGNLGIGFAIPINTVREILPQLIEGRVTRGRIGVQVLRTPMSQADAEALGLPDTRGAEVSAVSEGGPADLGGIQVGDIITRYNGQVVEDNGHLVDMVTRTAPGTRVPVEIYRAGERMSLNVTIEELDLDDERQTAAGPSQPQERPEPTDTGFGMTIDALTPRLAEQLRVPEGRGGAVVANVEPFSAAAQGNINRGDVILRVNNREVRSVDEASAALDAVPAGSTARIVVWRRATGEQLVLVRKR